MRTGIEGFYILLSHYRKLSVWAAGGSVAIPFVAHFIGVAPPFPEGINVITAIMQLLLLTFIYQSLSGIGRARATKILGRCLLGFVAITLIYFFLFFTLVITDPQGQQYVVGLSCTNEALIVHGDQCPFLNIDDLTDAAFAEQRLWKVWSIGLSHLILISSWFAMFGCIAGTLGTFLVYQLPSST